MFFLHRNDKVGLIVPLQYPVLGTFLRIFYATPLFGPQVKNEASQQPRNFQLQISLLQHGSADFYPAVIERVLSED